MQKRFSLLAALSLVLSSMALFAAPTQATDRNGAATLGKGSSSAVADGSRKAGKRARVVEVTDGDSIKVRLVKSGAPRNVRLIGIDTPEVHGQVECGGPEASRSLKRMLPAGTVVRLVADAEQDNRDLFNRLLRYVVKPNGRDMGRKQVRRGWAQIFIFGGETFERVAKYRRASKAAKEKDRGVWSTC
jgi:endonuclease YncB( thermonuclease family)